MALTLVATMVDMLNRILGTVPLNATQWGACLLAVIVFVILSEIIKLIVRLVNREGKS